MARGSSHWEARETEAGGGPSFITRGILDSTFGTNGIVTGFDSLPSANATTYLYGRVAPQGFLLSYNTVTFGPNTQRLTLVRYRPDGTLDSSFNTIGIASADIQPGLSGDSSLMPVMLPDGKPVAVGFGGGAIDFARFNTDGSLDTTFDVRAHARHVRRAR